MNPNINNISSFLTSIAEGHLYQSFYHQRMGLLRLGLVSECRVTKNTTNDTNFSHIFFNIFNVIVDYFKTTLTSADTKQKKWLLIPKVASNGFRIQNYLSLTVDISTEIRKTIHPWCWVPTFYDWSYIWSANHAFCLQISGGGGM